MDINEYDIRNTPELNATPLDTNNENAEASTNPIINLASNLSNLVRRATESFYSQPTQQSNQIQSRTIQPLLSVPTRHNRTTEIITEIIVPDYTQEIDFAKILLSMSFDEMQSLKNEILKYPSKFPMPGMKKIADEFKQKIDQIFKQLNLTEEESSILHEFLEELKKLAPQYPYEQSLIITVKFLYYMSFLEYKFLMFSKITNKYLKKNNFHDLSTEKLGRKYIHRLGEIKYAFKQECSLCKLKQLPWDQLLENNTEFEEQLLPLYDSMYLDPATNDFDAQDGGFKALKSDKILIPYTGEISPELFNKLWASPINLVHCTFKQLTSYMKINDFLDDTTLLLPNSVFEKNLLVISQKIFSLNNQEYLLQFIQNIYLYQEHLNRSIDFRTIEIALFYSLFSHCKGGRYENLENNFYALCAKMHSPIYLVFPEKYDGLTNKSIEIAEWWLFKLNAYFKQGKSFSCAIQQVKQDINSGLQSKELFENDHVSNCKIYTEEDVVSPIRQNLAKEIKNYQETITSYGINPSKLVTFLLYLDKKYPKLITILPPGTMHSCDDNVDDYMWLTCYLNTDVTLNSLKRIKQACKDYNKAKKSQKSTGITRDRISNVLHSATRSAGNTAASGLERIHDRVYNSFNPISRASNYLLRRIRIRTPNY
jgi:hypothetical protein